MELLAKATWDLKIKKRKNIVESKRLEFQKMKAEFGGKNKTYLLALLSMVQL